MYSRGMEKDCGNIRDESDELSAPPVTLWLRQLEQDELSAADALYQHFCLRLQEIASRRLPARVRRTYDADDVAVSAFQSLFAGVRDNRFDFRDRNDFWRLLLTIAERKIAKRIRYATRQKRDVRKLVENAIFDRSPPQLLTTKPGNLSSVAAPEPTPAFAAEVEESFTALLNLLPDETCRKIAVLRMENYVAEEIAEKLGCTRRTVQRKLLVIRRTWMESGKFEIRTT